ncbi:hypothetical protein [Polyangium jinanense]|uniref:Uncharacterized protein n=1 Tax=Polyangium jinanense TaxID=2829994 RepID=A0A9X3XG54_9BACT|nr:hypothetical protein [Polyangium jinanense]MDC3988800.1 hypothetical protein [Polyangium jinanense]
MLDGATLAAIGAAPGALSTLGAVVLDGAAPGALSTLGAVVLDGAAPGALSTLGAVVLDGAALAALAVLGAVRLARNAPRGSHASRPCPMLSGSRRRHLTRESARA